MKKSFIVLGLLGVGFAVLTACRSHRNSKNEPLATDSTTVEYPLVLPTLTDLPRNTLSPTVTQFPSQVPPTNTTTPETPWPVLAVNPPKQFRPEEEVFVREGELVPQPEGNIGPENAHGLVELARWGYGAIVGVIHSLDGQLMLVQTDVGVYAYRVGTLDEVWRYYREDQIDSIGITSANRLVIDTKDGLIIMLDVENGKELEIFLGQKTDIPNLVAQTKLEPDYHISEAVRSTMSEQGIYLEGFAPPVISPGERYIAVGGYTEVGIFLVEDGSLVYLFDSWGLESGKIPHLAKPAFRSGPGPERIESMAFSQDERYLVAANAYGDLFILDITNRRLHYTAHGNGETLLMVPYGNQMVLYDWDTIEIYAIPSGERTAQQNLGIGFQQLLYSPGGSRIAKGGTLWNTVEGTFETMPENEKVVGFSQNGNYVYSMREKWWWVERRTSDLVLYHQVLLDMNLDHDLGDWVDFVPWVEGPFWNTSPDGKNIQGGSYETPYLTWDTTSGELIRIGPGPSTSHYSAFSPNGQYLVEDIIDWETVISEQQPDESYEQINTIGSYISDIDFVDNQNLIITRGDVTIYKLPEMEIINKIRLGEEIIASAVSPDGTLLAVSLKDKLVLVDLEARKVLTSLDASPWNVTSLAFSPDGRYLATAADNGVIRLWGVLASSYGE